MYSFNWLMTIEKLLAQSRKVHRDGQIDNLPKSRNDRKEKKRKTNIEQGVSSVNGKGYWDKDLHRWMVIVERMTNKD